MFMCNLQLQSNIVVEKKYSFSSFVMEIACFLVTPSEKKKDIAPTPNKWSALRLSCDNKDSISIERSFSIYQLNWPCFHGYQYFTSNAGKITKEPHKESLQVLNHRSTLIFSAMFLNVGSTFVCWPVDISTFCKFIARKCIFKTTVSTVKYFRQ